MFGLRRNPIHMGCGDDSIVNLRVMTDKEDSVFVAGRFDSGPDSCLGSGKLFDFPKSDRPQIVHIFSKGKESVLSGRRELGIVIFDHPYATGSEHMFLVKDCVVNEVLDFVCHVGNGEALNHVNSLGRLCVCEGFETAKAIASSLSQELV